MTAYPRPFLPGMPPAVGHIAANGFWHPGHEAGCTKCPERRS